MRRRHSGVSELEKAVKHRWDDAQALYDLKRWRGSMYMAGYSVEGRLKCQLMRKFKCQELDELENELERRGLLPLSSTVFTHRLSTLLQLTERRDVLRDNALAWRQFNLVNSWLPAWRYFADLSNQDDAKRFLEAVESTTNWIKNNI